jgi:hypothetical protein
MRQLPQFPPSLTPPDVARGVNGHFLLNLKISIPNCEMLEEIPGGDRRAINRQSAFGGGEGGVGGGVLPLLKGTLYRFRMEQFGDIHCKITIRACSFDDIITAMQRKIK